VSVLLRLDTDKAGDADGFDPDGFAIGLEVC
jgi:hypothetical protein